LRKYLRALGVRAEGEWIELEAAVEGARNGGEGLGKGGKGEGRGGEKEKEREGEMGSEEVEASLLSILQKEHAGTLWRRTGMGRGGWAFRMGTAVERVARQVLRRRCHSVHAIVEALAVYMSLC